MDELAVASTLAEVAAQRTRELLDALAVLSVDDLERPSRLPGWTRLTVVCHLRYGTGALLRMTNDALDARPTAYYPEGRDAQRPITLHPDTGEGPGQVLSDWKTYAARLDETWSRFTEETWALLVREPEGNRDLGNVTVARLALMRLTELEVHGTDLGIGVRDWSREFVQNALPLRVAWLSTRRTNHRWFDDTARGSWLLTATDGGAWFISTEAPAVLSRAATHADTPRAEIEGTQRDLLALLLGRATNETLTYRRDVAFGQRFSNAFPGP